MMQATRLRLPVVGAEIAANNIEMQRRLMDRKIDSPTKPVCSATSI